MKPSAWASGVKGIVAPIAAQITGSTSIAPLGRLRRKGTRRVRITNTTSVCVASDSTSHPLWNSEQPQIGRHDVADAEGDHVARDKQRDVHRYQCRVAPDQRPR